MHKVACVHQMMSSYPDTKNHKNIFSSMYLIKKLSHYHVVAQNDKTMYIIHKIFQVSIYYVIKNMSHDHKRHCFCII